MSADVRAGGAFIELGINSKKLDEGLAAAKKGLESFAGLAVGLGASLAAAGAAITGPLVAAAHHFADFGHDIKTTMMQTGMSAEAVAAFGPKIEVFGHGIKEMQRMIAEGGKDAIKSLAALGLTLADLRGKTPEQQLGLIADRLSTVSDQGQKVAIGSQIFGRAFTEMLPALSRGSQGLNEMQARAQKMGTVLDSSALAAADRLYKGFKSLAQSLEGFGLAIGKAVAPVIGPLIDAFTEIVQGATAWVNENQELIKSVFEVGAGLTVLGTAFATLGATIFVAMSATFQIAAGFALIGASVLAVLDCLGVTNTGFGELFNSIRIGGTGLGTWLSALWVWIEKSFNNVVANLQYSALAIWDGFQWVITKVENAWLFMTQKLIESISAIVKAFNAIAPKSLQIDTRALDAAARTDRNQQNIGNAEIADRAHRRDQVLLDRDRRNASLDKQSKDLFLKDPQVGNAALGFDSSKAKEGLKHIGDNIMSGLMSGLDFVKGKLPTPKGVDASKIKTFGEQDTGIAPGLLDADKGKGSALGTFNAASAGQLGVGASIGERIANAAEKTARNTDPNNQQGSVLQM